MRWPRGSSRVPCTWGGGRSGCGRAAAGRRSASRDGESVLADLVWPRTAHAPSWRPRQAVPTIPRSSGYAAYRGLASPDLIGEVGDDQTAWLGPGRHFVHYPVSGGRALNFVGIVPSPRDEPESWNSAGDIAEARAHFAGWDPRVRKVIASADSVGLWGLYDRPVRDVLHAGRVVLVGDSAARVPRARKVQEVSYRNATLFHLADGAEQEARDARLGTPGAGDPLRDNDWLYRHDARDDATAALAANS